ncbi:hypothetical protein CR513_17864, partial [Mucuna pruriens]
MFKMISGVGLFLGSQLCGQKLNTLKPAMSLLIRGEVGNTNRMVSLNDINYHLWKGKIKDLLFVKKMHLPVFAAQKPESMSNEEWDFEHQQVYGFIRLFVDDNVYNHITSEIHARTFLKFKEGTSLSDHLNEFQGIIDQMSGMDIKFEDEILGLLLLNSLPESWEAFKVFITNSTPNGVVSLQMVKGSILNEEMRRKAQGFSSQSKALVTENRGEVKKRKEKRVEVYPSPDTRMWSENKGKKGKSKKKDDDRITIATNDDLVILRDFESVNFVSNESMWIIDSSVTLHVTPRKEFFTSYIVGDFGVLRMGNDGVTKVIGVGDVCLQTNIGM